MSVTRSTCDLCSKSDLLIKYELTTKQLQNAFFSVNKNLFSEDLVNKIQLCIICTYKIQLSAGIKREYDEMCNRSNKLNPNKCFFCEGKSIDLVSLNDNPNEVQDKIAVFINSVIIQHQYKDLNSCLRCLYNLDIWFEVRNNLYKIMNIPTSNHVQHDDATNNNIKDTPLRRSRKAILADSNTKKSSNTTKGTGQRPTRNTPSKDEKITWHKYLHEKLRSFQTVDKIIEKGDLNLSVPDIETDEDKLFKTLPFVEIFINSQISKERILKEENKNTTTIVISDSEQTVVSDKKMKTRGKKLNFSLKKTETPKNTKRKPSKVRSTPKKNLIKFKMPFLSKRLSLKASSTPKNFTGSVDSSSESSEPTVELSSEDEQSYMCSVCEKTFTVKCDYLSHTLKHEKIENLVVNVSRQHLPEKLKVTELKISQSKNITTLLTKWIGENAAKTYEDMSQIINQESIESEANEEEEQNQEEEKTTNNETSEKTLEVKTTNNETSEETPEGKTTNNETSEETPEAKTTNNETSEETPEEDTNHETSEEAPDEKITNSKTSEETPKEKTTNNETSEETPQEKTTNNETSEETPEEMETEAVKESESIQNDGASEKKDEEDREVEEEKNEDMDVDGEVCNKGNESIADSDATVVTDDDDDDKSETETVEEKRKEESTSSVKQDGSVDENLPDTQPSEKEVNSSDTEKVSNTKESSSDTEENDKISETEPNDDDNEDDEDVSNEDKITEEQEKENEEEEENISNQEDVAQNDDTDVGVKETEDKCDDSQKDDESSQNVKDKESDDAEKTDNGADKKKNGDDVNIYEIDDDLDGSEFSTPPVMTCEDLLNILETNECDNAAANKTNSSNNDIDAGKRKRESCDEEVMPKRKKVRFADEKEIFTPDKSIVFLEKIVENDQFLHEDED